MIQPGEDWTSNPMTSADARVLSVHVARLNVHSAPRQMVQFAAGGQVCHPMTSAGVCILAVHVARLNVRLVLYQMVQLAAWDQIHIVNGCHLQGAWGAAVVDPGHRRWASSV